MKFKILIDRNVDAYLERELVLIIDKLSDDQFARASQLMENMIIGMWVPLPVCFGEWDDVGECAWLQKDGYVYQLERRCLKVMIPLLSDIANPDYLLELDGEPLTGWDLPDSVELEEAWLRFLPIVNDFLKPILVEASG